jgi:hypothetical protein
VIIQELVEHMLAIADAAIKLNPWGVPASFTAATKRRD